MDQPKKIGKYDILERVGRGGMGVLYRGRDPVLEREVAIKVMLADFAEDETARPRFYREARAAAKLQHRNIVTVHEFGEEEHAPYIVMEFLRGQDLSKRVHAQPPLKLEEKLDIIAELCTGLQYAHQQGVIHRDVKPGNIWIQPDGTVKLLDFGIAKLDSGWVTRAGSVFGSAAYMAPEQVLGQAADARADIFSAGVVLYELLAGRKPFEAETPTGVLARIIEDKPEPIEKVVPGLPPALITAVNSALEKDPQKRFQSAGDFANELRIIRASLPSGTVVTAPSERALAAQKAAEEKAGAAGEQQATGGGVAGVLTWLRSDPRVVWGVIGAGALIVILIGWRALAPGGKNQPAGATAQAGQGTQPAAATGAQPPQTPTAGAQQPTVQPASMAQPVMAAPSGPVDLFVASNPESGATIFLDGRDTKKKTPAKIRVEGLGHKVRLVKRGFVNLELPVTAQHLHAGQVEGMLTKPGAPVVQASSAPAQSATAQQQQVVQPPPVTAAGVVDVVVRAAYPVDVFDGSQIIKTGAANHEFQVRGRRTIRIRSEDVLLDMQRTVDPNDGKNVEIDIPGPGTLRLIWSDGCSARIDNVDLGSDPPVDKVVASGVSHRVRVTCPDGRSGDESHSVQAGQRKTASVAAR